MASNLSTSFLPALAGDLADIGPKMVQGQVQGMQLARELALLDMQLKNQQMQMQQQQALFPFQQQTAGMQAQQQRQLMPLELEKAKQDIEYKKSLGFEASQRGKMYSGGMYPPGTVEESMRRRLLIDPNDPQAIQFFSSLGTVAGVKAGGVLPLGDLELQTMAFRSQQDPTYKPEFKGPYAALDKQRYEGFMAGKTPAPASSPMQPGAPLTPTSVNPEQRAGKITEQRIDFQTRKNTETAFATGAQGKAVKSMNVAIAHLDTLKALGKALPQNNLQDINRVFNFFGVRAGADPVTNFNTAKKIVADEITKAIVGGATALGDREETVANIMAFNSPQQLQGAIDTYIELMAGQLKGLKQEYEGGTRGKGDFNRYLLPDVRKRLEVSPHRSAPSSQKTIKYSDLP